MRVELSVEHGIQRLLLALSDFFVEVILSVEVVKHQINEQLIGYLYVFHSLRFLSATIATIATVILVVSF